MRRLLAVFAHPDDETFSIGGTLARLAAGGARTALYIATDGAAGRSSGVELSGRAELARVRRAELLRAAGVLGVGRVFLAGWPDGELASQPADDVVADVARAIRLVRPQVVVTFGPEGAPNRHRDHRAISRATTAAFFLAGQATAFDGHAATRVQPWAPSRLFYFTWSEAIAQEFGVEGQPATCRVRVAEWTETKRRAFDEHRTQWDHRARFEQTLEEEERFFLASGPAGADGDLFAELPAADDRLS